MRILLEKVNKIDEDSEICVMQCDDPKYLNLIFEEMNIQQQRGKESFRD